MQRHTNRPKEVPVALRGVQGDGADRVRRCGTAGRAVLDLPVRVCGNSGLKVFAGGQGHLAAGGET